MLIETLLNSYLNNIEKAIIKTSTKDSGKKFNSLYLAFIDYSLAKGFYDDIPMWASTWDAADEEEIADDRQSIYDYGINREDLMGYNSLFEMIDETTDWFMFIKWLHHQRVITAVANGKYN